jgi:hypothetical protein
MSFTHILRVLFAVFLSGAIGWVSLFVFHFIKITQQFEAFEATASDGEAAKLMRAMADAVHNIEGGSALFLAAGIAGVLLSEIFKTRQFLFYAGATGALTAVLAAALWQQANAAGNAQTAAALAMAGFVAGGVYWMIAGPSAPRG